MAVKLRTTDASETWRSIITAFTRVNGVLAAEMDSETGVSLDWYGILLMLTQADGEAMRPSDLAASIGLSRSATTRLVDRLERNGLVKRETCPDDRRGSFVSLTAKGEDLFKKAGRVHLRGIDQHVGSHLSPSEMADLRRILTKLADTVGGDALALIGKPPSGG
jgi:DNA-binding MarR family transcriptional regulator